jgi:hypothetical protein
MIPLLPAMAVDPGTDALFSQGFFGLVLLIAGFCGLGYSRKLHLIARALQETPVAPIAQAGSGLVRVRGSIAADPLLLSPLTQTPCCCYQVVVEEPSDEGTSTGMGWRPLHVEVSNAPFALRDGTGTIEIHPEGLEISAPATFQQEVISRARDSREETMLAYVREHCPNKLNRFLLTTMKQALLTPEQEAAPQMQERLRQFEDRRHRQLHKETKGQSFLFRETCFLPGQELEIAGSSVVDGSRRMLGKGPDRKRPFLLSTQFGEALNRQQSRKARNLSIASAVALVAGVLEMVFRLPR